MKGKNFFADSTHTLEDTIPSSGMKVFKVFLGDPAHPNAIAKSVVVDESGQEVDLNLLNVAETRALFVPDMPIFPPPPDAADFAITISPTCNDFVLSECEPFKETITVTIPAAAKRADIYFLADTTGSMGSVLSAVQAGANAMLASLAATGWDLHYGVGNYKDFPGSQAVAFNHQLSMTNVTAGVATAINTWSAAGGGDGPEGQFFALDQLADYSLSGTFGWRGGNVKKLIVWFGDAPAHDAVCAAISGLGYDISEASVTSKLVAEQITVLAVGVTTGYPLALDDDPVATSSDYNSACGAAGGAAGQASRIAAATGGSYTAGVTPMTIVPTILAAITASVSAIGNVMLQPDYVIQPFLTSITPASYGPLSGTEDHVLTFEVEFTAPVCADRERVYTGSIDVLMDYYVVASKPTKITVPACEYTYSIKYVCGEQSDCPCTCSSVRPGKYATEINLHNPNCCQYANIKLSVLPLVLMGSSPECGAEVCKDARYEEWIGLSPGCAALRDCCTTVSKLVGRWCSSGASSAATTPLNIGFIEIRSSVKLNITAVYTASDLLGNGLSIDVTTVTGELLTACNKPSC